MSVDRPEVSTTEPAGNGQDVTASPTPDEPTPEGGPDRTETMVSPGYGEREPIVVPPAGPPSPPQVPSVAPQPAGVPSFDGAPPATGAPSAAPPYVGGQPSGAGPAPAPGDPYGPGYEQPLRPRPRRAVGDGPEGRWVTHRLRNVSLWSVFKVATLFYVCLFFSLLVATVLLWNVGRASGTIDRVEGFVSSAGAYGECVPEKSLKPGTEFEQDDNCRPGNVRVGNFHLDGGVVFRSALFGGLVFVVAATIGTMLLTILFNLLNDITGGVRYSMIREPGGGPPAPARARRRAPGPGHLPG
jgi:hypothetical protein